MKLKLLLTLTLFCNVFFINATNNPSNIVNDVKEEVLVNDITCSVFATSFCSGTSATITYTASGTYASGNVFTAQLSDASGSFMSPVNIGTKTAIVSGTISGVIPFNATFGTGYRIRVIASNPSTIGEKNGLNLTINPIRISSFPAIAPICSGSTPPILPTTSLDGITGTWSPALNNIQTTDYTFTPTLGQCAISTFLTVTVFAAPIIFSPTPLQVCDENNDGFACFDLHSKDAEITKNSQNLTVSYHQTFMDAQDGTNSLISPYCSNFSNQIIFVRIFNTQIPNCSSFTTLQLVVNPLPIASSSPNNLSICSGTTTNINLSSTQIGTIFDWVVVSRNVTGASSASGNVIKQILTTFGNSQGTVVYNITPIANGCVGIPITATVNVNPLPLLEPIPNVSACSSYTLPQLLEGSYYTGPGGTGALLLAGDQITTSTMLSVSVINGFCSASYPHSITIITEPKPEIVTENNSNEIYIDNTTVVQPLLLDSQLTNEYSFQWYENDILIDGATNSTYLVNTVSQNANPRNFTVSASKGICESTSSVFEVNQIPVPAPSGNRLQSFTQGQTLADLEVEGSNIQWYADRTGNRNANATPLPLTTVLVNGATYYASQTINGFESPSRLDVIVQVALSNDSFAFKDLKFSPNPIIDVLTIQSNEIFTKISIYNILGQEVLRQKGNGLELKLDLSHLISGNYFVKVVSDAEQQVFKVVKQ